MTREEFYKLTDILNSEVLGNFMHGGEADELIAMFEETVEQSNVLEQEEPVSEDLEEAADKYESEQQEKYKDRDNHDFDNYRDGFVDGLTHTYNAFKAGAEWQKEQMMAKAIDGKVIANGMGNPILHLWDKGRHLLDKKVKVIVIKED